MSGPRLLMIGPASERMLGRLEEVFDLQHMPDDRAAFSAADAAATGYVYVNGHGGVPAELIAALPGLAIVTWQERQASLFKALAMEKLVTTILLLMIVVVGAVNIVSTLVMAVTDKRANIAILRTMGASSASISAIFIVQGMIAGIAGTLTGTALGVLLGHNIAAISETLERWLNMLPWQEPVYLLAHLQTWIEAREVLLIALAALSISLVATLYPAWRSSKVQPAEVLRHE